MNEFNEFNEIKNFKDYNRYDNYRTSTFNNDSLGNDYIDSNYAKQDSHRQKIINNNTNQEHKEENNYNQSNIHSSRENRNNKNIVREYQTMTPHAIKTSNSFLDISPSSKNITYRDQHCSELNLSNISDVKTLYEKQDSNTNIKKKEKLGIYKKNLNKQPPKREEINVNVTTINSKSTKSSREQATDGRLSVKLMVEDNERNYYINNKNKYPSFNVNDGGVNEHCVGLGDGLKHNLKDETNYFPISNSQVDKSNKNSYINHLYYASGNFDERNNPYGDQIGNKLNNQFGNQFQNYQNQYLQSSDTVSTENDNYFNYQNQQNPIKQTSSLGFGNFGNTSQNVFTNNYSHINQDINKSLSMKPKPTVPINPYYNNVNVLDHNSLNTSSSSIYPLNHSYTPQITTSTSTYTPNINPNHQINPIYELKLQAKLTEISHLKRINVSLTDSISQLELKTNHLIKENLNQRDKLNNQDLIIENLKQDKINLDKQISQLSLKINDSNEQLVKQQFEISNLELRNKLLEERIAMLNANLMSSKALSTEFSETQLEAIRHYKAKEDELLKLIEDTRCRALDEATSLGSDLKSQIKQLTVENKRLNTEVKELLVQKHKLLFGNENEKDIHNNDNEKEKELRRILALKERLVHSLTEKNDVIRKELAALKKQNQLLTEDNKTLVTSIEDKSNTNDINNLNNLNKQITVQKQREIDYVKQIDYLNTKLKEQEKVYETNIQNLESKLKQDFETLYSSLKFDHEILQKNYAAAINSYKHDINDKVSEIYLLKSQNQAKKKESFNCKKVN